MVSTRYFASFRPIWRKEFWKKARPDKRQKLKNTSALPDRCAVSARHFLNLARRPSLKRARRFARYTMPKNASELPGTLVRSEGDAPTADEAVDEAYDGSGATHDLYAQAFGRNSINNSGLELISTVHFLEGYDNAFWNGEQMVYGDGDEDLPEEERLFNRFTIAIDIIGHELTHGVTQYEANLVYRNQAGALNESFSDVFGSLVKQRVMNQRAEEADWLIGEGLFTSRVNARGIRSMKAPGTAYDDPLLGRDPQPGHMNDYVETTADNGGVHINSGIPNKAFYNVALELGGYAWEKAGQIWYRVLCDELDQASDFQAAANACHKVAADLYGSNSPEQKAVYNGWQGVGIIPVSDQQGGCRGWIGRAWRSVFGGRQT
jgi:Zn-dependent metalloprotease